MRRHWLLWLLILLFALPGHAEENAYFIARDVCSLPEGIFQDYTGEILVAEGHPYFAVTNGFLINKLTSVLLYAAPSSIGLPLPAVRRLGAHCLDNWPTDAQNALTIPDTVEEIGNDVFAVTQAITLPAGLRSLGERAFTNESEAEITIDIPVSTAFVAWDAFSPSACWQVRSQGANTRFESKGAYLLRSECILTQDDANAVILQDGPFSYKRVGNQAVLTSIDWWGFGSEEIPQRIELPQTLGEEQLPLRGIGFNALNMFEVAAYEAIEEIVIPEGVIYFEYGAFTCCEHVARLSFPSTLAIIPEACFQHVWADICVHPDNPYFEEKDGFLIDRRSATLLYTACSACDQALPWIRRVGCGGVDNWKYEDDSILEIPASVEQLGAHCFWEHYNYRELRLPEGLRVIEENALGDLCITLRIPSTVLYIGWQDGCMVDDYESLLDFAGERPYMQSIEEFDAQWMNAE